MNIDLALVLEFSHPSDNTQVILEDRYGQITKTILSNDSRVELNFKFSVPNQLRFILKNINSEGSSVTLKSLILGGLPLPQHIIEQICCFTPINSTHSSVLPCWYQEGEITVDFFAGDWVQYHLLYGNKITFDNS
jgi:hypothetical protein